MLSVPMLNLLFDAEEKYATISHYFSLYDEDSLDMSEDDLAGIFSWKRYKFA